VCVCVCTDVCVHALVVHIVTLMYSIPREFECAGACARVFVFICVSSHYRRSVEVVYVSECMCTCVCVYMVSL